MLWQVAIIAVALTSAGALSSCSPYAFSKEVQSFSDKLKLIDTSYQDSARQTLAEQRLTNRIKWIRDKPDLCRGPGCNIDATGAVPCDLAVVTRKPAEPTNQDVPTLPTEADVPAVPTQAPLPDVCEPAASHLPAPSTQTVGELTPLQRTDLLSALDNYASALAAITQAADRADFNNASAKLSNAVAALAQTAAAASGVAAAGAPAIGSIAQVSSNTALWLVGQGLDYQRLKKLRAGTGAACEPIHVLAGALGVMLEEQQGNRLDGLYSLLLLRIQAVNIARVSPHITDSGYGSAIDDAQAAADAFQAVRTIHSEAIAQALSAAHDALVVAVRNNDGQLDALVASLQTLAETANGLASAANATSLPASTATASKQ